MFPEKLIEFVVTDQVDEEFSRFLQSKIARFNDLNSSVRDTQAEPLNIELLDENGKSVGGVAALTYWGWVVFELFYVNEKWRGQGLGKQLLERAESEAKKRGCQRAHTSTYDFQALEFYQKQGIALLVRLKTTPTVTPSIGYAKILSNINCQQSSEKDSLPFLQKR